MLHLIAERPQDPAGSVGDPLFRTRLGDPRSETREGAVSARDPQSVASRNHVRSVHETPIDGPHECDVGEPSRADVTDGREAGHQGSMRVPHRPNRDVGRRLLNRTVHPVALEVVPQVGVCVHQARKQRGVTEVDQARTVRW